MSDLNKKAEECHEDDPKHEQKEQEKAKKIKEKAEEILDMHKGEHCTFNKSGQWSLQKGAAKKVDMGGSAFKQEHVNQVAATKDHAAAKAIAHKAVDESTANAKNKMQMKAMINSSKNSSHLAMGMQNHILAHPSEGLKVVKG